MEKILTLLKATREMVKQFSEIKDENTYREKCLEMLCKTIDLQEIEWEMLMYLSEWDCYVYEWKYVDFTILWNEKDNKIRARASHNKSWWKYVEYSTIYEINANENLRYIVYQLENLDENYK